MDDGDALRAHSHTRSGCEDSGAHNGRRRRQRCDVWWAVLDCESNARETSARQCVQLKWEMHDA